MKRSTLKLQILEPRRLLASDWQNAIRVHDVNADRLVTPVDALVGIQRLTTSPNQNALPPRAAGSTEPFYDVNGDGFQTPIDILLVIDRLQKGEPIAIQLANDTGRRTDSGFDGITFDGTIAGTIRGRTVDRLFARVDDASNWVDVSQWLGPNDTFNIPSASLDAAMHQTLQDGFHRIYFCTENPNTNPNSLADRVPFQFTLDRKLPIANFFGDIDSPQSNAIEIPFDERLSPSSINANKIRLYDITFDVDESERVELIPVAIRLSTSGRSLVIDPPANSEPMKYQIELDAGAVEDVAGNALSAPVQTIANYSPANPQTISIGSTVDIAKSPQPQVLEFEFTLTAATRLLWAENEFRISIAKYELYSRGEQIREWSVNPFQPDTPKIVFLPLPAGTYRLRVLPTSNFGHMFTLLDESTLPELPRLRPDRIDDWTVFNADVILPFEAYKLHLKAGEQLTVNAQRPGPLGSGVIRTILGPSRETLSIDAGLAQSLMADEDADYVLLIYRQPFTSTIDPAVVVPPPPYNPWQPPANIVASPIPVPLPNEEIHLKFDNENSRFAFSFHADAGELFQLNRVLPAGNFDIRAVNGEPGFGNWGANDQCWRAELAGDFVLTVSSFPGSEVVFQFRKLISQPLVQNQVTSITLPAMVGNATQSKTLEPFRFVPNSDQFVVKLKSDSPGIWQVIDANLNAVASGFFALSVFIRLDVHPGRTYYLSLEGDSGKSFEVEWTTPIQTTKALSLSQLETGTLASPGDRAIYSVLLERGHRYRVEQWDASTWQIKKSWLEGAEQTFPREVTSGESWLVSKTGTYRLQIENQSAEPIQFQLKLVEVPVSNPSSTPSGFGTLHQGTIRRGTGVVPNEVEFTFTADSGTPIGFDWTSGIFQVVMRIVGPSGAVLIHPGGQAIIATKESGVHRVFISTTSTDPIAYAFRIVTPMQGEEIALNHEYQITPLNPQEKRFLRVPISTITDVFLDAASQFGLEASILRPTDSVWQLTDARMVAESFVYIQLRNAGSEPMTPRLQLNTLQPLVLGQPSNVPVRAGQQIGFVIDTSGISKGFEVILPQVATSPVFARLFDSTWSPLDRTDYSGIVYVVVQVPSDYAGTNLPIMIYAKQQQELPLNVGQQFDGSLSRLGDSYKFNISFDPSQAIVLQFTSNRGMGVSLTGPDGIRHNFLDVSRRIPIQSSGLHSLEITCETESATFSLKFVDLLQVPLITSEETINLTPSDSFRVFQLDGGPGDRLRVDVQSADYRVVDQFAQEQLIGSPIVTLGSGGNKFLLLSGTQTSHVQVAKTRDRDFQGTLGAWYSGEFLGAGDRDFYHFDIADLASFRFEFEGDARIVLKGPEGATISDPQAFFARAIPPTKVGRYQLAIEDVGRQHNYRLRLVRLDQVDPILLDRPTEVAANTNYRLRIPVTSLHKLEIFNADGTPVDATVLIEGNGRFGELGSRAMISAGDYWLKISGAAVTAKSTIMVRAIRQSSIDARLGQLQTVTLAADGLDETTLRMRVQVGQLVFPQVVSVPTDASVLFRFVDGLSENGLDQWKPIKDLVQPMAMIDNGTIELLVTGKGAVRLQMVDLLSLPVLTLSGQSSATIQASRNWFAWTIEPIRGQTITFSQLPSLPNGTTVWLLDSDGGRLSEVKQGTTVAFVNSKWLILFLSLPEALHQDTAIRVVTQSAST